MKAKTALPVASVATVSEAKYRSPSAKPETLNDLLRKPSGGGGTQNIPDIHGTDRSPAAVALVMERAYQIINRLAAGALTPSRSTELITSVRDAL